MTFLQRCKQFPPIRNVRPPLPVRPHDLRGTHETLLLDASVPVHVVAARCRHDPAAVLLRNYAKRTRKADRSAAGVIGIRTGDEPIAAIPLANR
jgi:integrase